MSPHSSELFLGFSLYLEQKQTSIPWPTRPCITCPCSFLQASRRPLAPAWCAAAPLIFTCSHMPNFPTPGIYISSCHALRLWSLIFVELLPSYYRSQLRCRLPREASPTVHSKVDFPFLLPSSLYQPLISLLHNIYDDILLMSMFN